MTGGPRQPYPLLAPLGNYGGPTQTMACCPAARPIGDGHRRHRPAPPTSAASAWLAPRHRRLPDPDSVVESADGDGRPTRRSGLTLPGGCQPGQSVRRRRHDHLRPDCLRHAADDHPDGRPARAERHSGPETITGPAAGVTVSGGGTSRVFQVDLGCHGIDLGPDDHRGHDRWQRRRPVNMAARPR